MLTVLGLEIDDQLPVVICMFTEGNIVIILTDYF